MLNRRQPVSLILVHGLFTSAGFWIPYLPLFRDFRLVLLEVDYADIDQLEIYGARARKIIADQSCKNLAGVIAHSLGTLLASASNEGGSLPQYDICPVYRASRKNVEEFINDILLRVDGALSRDEIRAQLARVDRALTAYVDRRVPPRREIYIPSEDRYFLYDDTTPFTQFDGNHFAIDAAVTNIVDKLRRQHPLAVRSSITKCTVDVSPK